MISFFKKLFLENRSLKQIVAKNTFWLVSAEVISRVLALFLVIYIARILGATEYGKFTFAFSFASIMAILCDLGLADISTREFSRNKENESKLAGILGIEAILCFLTLIIAVIGSFFITTDQVIRQSIWILTLLILSNGFFGIIFSFLRARQKMEYEAGIKILQAFINWAAVFLIIFNIPSVINLSYGYFLSNAIVLIATLIFFNFYFQKLSLSFDKKNLEILKISWPLSLGLMIAWIYISLNSVMLGAFNLITENGWYNAASKISIVAILPASLIIKSFYPVLSSLFVSSKEKLQKAWNYLMELMILLALPTVVGGIALSSKIIKSFYGSDFIPSILALQLLMVAVGISFLNYPYAAILVVSDHQKRNFGLIIFGAILNIILNLFLIPMFGFYGTIISTIISSLVVFLLTIFYSQKMGLISPFNKDLFKVSLMSLISSFAMYFVIVSNFIAGLNIIFVVLIGAFIYCLILLLFYMIFFPKRLSILKKWKSL